MPRRWSRRQRLVARAAILCVALVAVVAAGLAWLRPAPEAYVPGTGVEGLTQSLARDLPAGVPPRRFVDAAVETGIVFDHFHGVRSQQLPEDMGSGAAWADVDGDGHLDLYAVNEAGPLTAAAEWSRSPAANALFHRQPDGTFTDVAAAAGLDLRAMGQGAAFGDADGDGDADLVVTEYGPHRLFLNESTAADIRFREASAEAGWRGDGFWSGASWADADADGDLDLYVCQYVDYDPDPALLHRSSRQYDVVIPASLNPSTFPPMPNRHYRNRGDGTFDEIAASVGIDNAKGRSLSATWADFDNDGHLDLYVANDLSDNVLYMGSAGGTFTDVSHAAWVADYRGAMGLATGDWDADGDTDLFVTHWIAQENALYSNVAGDLKRARDADASAPGARFMDVADQFGLGQVALDFVGWGTGFLDYDLDGRLDLLVVNGSTFPDADDGTKLVAQGQHLFWHGGERLGYYEVSAVAGEALTAPAVGRGLAIADYDEDGDEDAFLLVNGGRARLLRNDGNPGHWLQVVLRAPEAAAQRARVRVTYGDARQVRAGGVSSSYLSQHTPVRHFGLGATTRLDSVVVDWPSGPPTVRLDVDADQRLVLAPLPGHEAAR